MAIQMYECRLKKAGLLHVSDVSEGERCMSAADAARIGTALTQHVAHEQVWALILTGKNTLLGVVRLAEGGLHGAALSPVDVLRPVLVAGSSALILTHNHPSGDPTPSSADVQMTRLLVSAFEPIGVSLLDHVVVTRDPAVFSSMRELDIIVEP